MKLTDKIELHNADCMEIMAQYPDNHFELAIVDPPYGIGDFRQTRSKKHHKSIRWNNNIPHKDYFIEMERISKNRIIWGAPYYTKYVSDVGRIVHDKTGCGKRNMPKEFSDCDIASHSFGVNMKIFHYVSVGNVSGFPENTLDIDWENKNRVHPCQKPVALYKWLLKNYAKEGDKILDTHLGSGSIAIACHQLGFELVGCELDKDYFDAAVKRIQGVTSQQDWTLAM